MRKCVCCKQAEAGWAWQPFGPGEHITVFTTLGSQYRGFAVLPVCDACQVAITQGEPVYFTYKQTPYVAVKGGVNEAPF